MISCNYYKMKSNPFNVVITADMWDREGATRTQGTITIDGNAVEWYLAEPKMDETGKHWGGRYTPLFIDGTEQGPAYDLSYEQILNAQAKNIFDALAERHCPETSTGCHDYECPVCEAKHELFVFEICQQLKKQGITTRMAI